jgi:hypothetical protein
MGAPSAEKVLNRKARRAHLQWSSSLKTLSPQQVRISAGRALFKCIRLW